MAPDFYTIDYCCRLSYWERQPFAAHCAAWIRATHPGRPWRLGA